MRFIVLAILSLFGLQAQSITETFVETKDQLKLKALYTVPQGEVKDAILMIQGSGPTDMDGNSHLLPVKMNYFKDLSDSLVQAGFATFRYDKRTCSATAAQLNLNTLVFEDLIEDARRALLKLKSYGYKKVYVLGHSQGALIASILAKETKLKGVLIIAGAGISIDQVLMQQLRDAYGVHYQLKSDTIIKSIKKGQAVAMKDLTPETMPVAQPNIQKFMQSWMAYDPQEVLANVKCSVLLMYGGWDSQVPIFHGEMLKEAQQKAHFIGILNMNHLLFEVKSEEENQASYQKGGNICAKAVQGILDFLTER